MQVSLEFVVTMFKRKFRFIAQVKVRSNEIQSLSIATDRLTLVRLGQIKTEFVDFDYWKFRLKKNE